MIYYNDNDQKACAWLRELIAQGHLPAGYVDQRSIKEVEPDELKQYTQCHFFAGIGGWPLALQLAGWPDDRPVWTGSCPCQPFSSMGARKGLKDDRHLWPVWFTLISECKPDIIFGEQVDEAIREGWLCTVTRDMDSENYAVAPFVLSSRSAGAPDVRYRVWFTAHSQKEPRLYKPISREASQRLSDNETYWQANPWDATEPTLYSLDDGLPSMVGYFEGFGNAINPQVAAEFIKATMETIDDL